MLIKEPSDKGALELVVCEENVSDECVIGPWQAQHGARSERSSRRRCWRQVGRSPAVNDKEIVQARTSGSTILQPSILRSVESDRDAEACRLSYC